MSISANFPNVKPSLLLDFANAQQLPPSVTFTRATTATYYNGSTTALADQNLVLQSQDFNNAYWADKSNTTVTVDSTTAPDGTSTADTIFETSATAGHWVGSGFISFLAGQTYTFSVYAKNISGGRGFINLSLFGAFAAGSYAQFNLSTGAVGTTSGVTASIVSVGNNWYRCIATATANTTTSERFYVTLSNGTSAQFPSYAGDVTKGIFVWGAQLEQRSAVTAYTATTTASITNYVPVLLTAGGGQPRFDHNPTTSESLGLLIEQQSTNQLTYSQDFSNGVWSKTAATITADTIVAPDGTLTGDKLVCDTTTGFVEKFTNRSIYGFVGQTVTGSVYLKRGEFTWAQVNLFNGVSNANRVWVNLATGVIGSNPSGIATSITSVGNGWYRVTMTATIQSSGSAFITVALADADADENTTVANGFSGTYVWGAQLEVGAVASSYIPTVAAAATRAADSATMTGTNFSSWFDLGEGTFYAELSLGNLGTDQCVLGVNASNSYDVGNGLLFRCGGNTTNVSFGGYNSGASAVLNPVASVNTPFKMIAKYQVSTKLQAVQGNAGSVGSSNTLDYIGSGTNQLQISGYRGGTEPLLVARVKKIAYYPVAISNAQMQALTS